jgi:hypothetical protein
MKQRVTYKTNDGTIKEQLFDDFEEFADSMESVAHQYYQGLKTPDVKVDSMFDDGLINNEKVTNVESTITRGSQFLSENS